ncbi:DUF1643 domain-containing protein [Desulfobaculum sp. SPO524]|uniref:DUF1643 domain-containing protein n=1 Tax=Desulfobaculum sp. SPO524 TaxID=3378071 RepID=UPI0038524C69
MKTSAIISDCGQYRYELRRIWNSSKPLALFICHNPSTADHATDDRTSKRCINYAKDWGYGGLLMGNLFAFRSTDRTALRHTPDPVGPENDYHLRRMINEASITICAWSCYNVPLKRDLEVIKFIPSPMCLKINPKGRPYHPLMQKKTLTPIPYVVSSC